MADCEKRPRELSREVALLQEGALEEERRGGPPAVLATYVRLQAGVAVYVEWREKAFTNLLWLVPDSSASAQSQQERWTNGVNQRGGEAFRMLNEQVARDDDPIEFTFELLAMQESMSYTAIAGMPLAGFMGQVREHMRDFEKFRKDLDDRWKEINHEAYHFAQVASSGYVFHRQARLLMVLNAAEPVPAVAIEPGMQAMLDAAREEAGDDPELLLRYERMVAMLQGHDQFQVYDERAAPGDHSMVGALMPGFFAHMKELVEGEQITNSDGPP